YRLLLAGSALSPQIPDERPRKKAVSPATLAWKDALLHPSSLVPLMLGVYLMATVFGLPPSGRIFPSIGAVVAGVGLGRVLRLRTGRRAFFLIALGIGLALAGLFPIWRGESPWWWLFLAGGIVFTVGLTRLRRIHVVEAGR